MRIVFGGVEFDAPLTSTDKDTVASYLREKGYDVTPEIISITVKDDTVFVYRNDAVFG